MKDQGSRTKHDAPAAPKYPSAADGAGESPGGSRGQALSAIRDIAEEENIGFESIE